ncbi:hypothetical protein [Erwinia aphidicola]|jgi:hypothetical protein|uniref:Uncharacterized protein n=1 Tax=Erwinia aphidicola TaxID=68334 RepID=A0ABU8DLJ8_ERWAP
MSKETGGPAFPTPATEWHGHDEGMTLRDYFAGKALQGILSAGIGLNVGPSHAEEMEGAAKTIYLMADAMIAARGE